MPIRFQVGTSQPLKCYKSAYEDILDEYQFSLFQGGKITVYDSSFRPLPEDEYTVTVKDSVVVSYRLNIQNTGSYYLTVESGEKENIVPSAVKVTVCVKPSFSNLKFYNSEEEYKNGEAPLEMTPEFQEDVYNGYSIEAPDYMDIFTRSRHFQKRQRLVEIMTQLCARIELAERRESV